MHLQGIPSSNIRLGLIFFSIIFILGIGSVWAGAHSSPHHEPAVIPTAPPMQAEPIETNKAQSSQPTQLPTNQADTPRRSGGIYPNASLTPGDIITGVTATQVCTPGYSVSVRDVPVSVKVQVYAEYGIKYPQTIGAFETDHLISLELGGSNSIKNLWPEPADPTPGYHQKDQVENYLHSQVCNGKLSLADAQNKIRTDWYQVYLQMNGINTTTSTQVIGGLNIRPTSTGATTQASKPTGRCVDGTYTYALNHTGACSHHGGVAQWL